MCFYRSGLVLPGAQLKLGDICFSYTQFVPQCDVKLKISTFNLTTCSFLHKWWEGSLPMSVWCLGLVPWGSAGNNPNKQHGAAAPWAYHLRGEALGSGAVYIGWQAKTGTWACRLLARRVRGTGQVWEYSEPTG